MEKEFVSYKQALSLKELGFDEECLLLIQGKNIYCNTWPFESNYEYPKIEEEMYFYIGDILERNHLYRIKIPLKQQIFRWFREKYGYDSLVTYTQNKYLGFVTDHKTGYYLTATNDFSIHEEAENALIDKLIELAKQQD